MTEIFNKQNQTDLRRKLRNNPTKGESVLWKHLKNNQLGYKFRRQSGIGKYIVDFYCPKVKLVIEIDGLTHHDEKIFLNDEVRQKYLEGLGLTVRRYDSGRIFFDIKEVLVDIYNFCEELNKTTPSSPPS